MTLHAEVLVEREGFTLDAALDAEGGSTVALLGPNGSGKSTFVRALAGLEATDEARIVLNGADLSALPPQRRPIGVVFQDLRLFPRLSAVENAAFPLRACGRSRAGARTRARELLATLGVPTGRMDARPANLSGGEAQRVALARSLIAEPALLLLDEPTSSLDVRARADLRPLIRSTLAAFPGVRVLVTHDPVEAMTLADRLVILEEGHTTQVGTPAEIRQAPRSSYVADLVGLNLYAGRLEPLDEGAGSLETGEGRLVVAWPVGEPRTHHLDGVTATLRPADVVLHTTRPEGGSARNLLHGPIAALSIEGERARVRIASAPPVVAEITLGSVARLGLHEGAWVWASCKAVELTLRLRA
jgi:molybdate transport system ATP-binding protein